MRSAATTAEDYLAGLPEDRVEVSTTVRQTLLASLTVPEFIALSEASRT